MKNVAALIILMIMLLLGGMYATSKLKVEMMPDMSFPVVMVSTQYTAPPKDVMEQITEPLEKSISGLDGLKTISSTSSDSFSSIFLELENGYDAEDAKQEVENLVKNTRLPQSAESPTVATFGFASQPVYYLSLYGQNGMNQVELDKLYNDVILPGLESISGLDHVDSIGNQEATLTIQLDADMMNHYGLTPSQVTNYIQASVMASPAGTVELNGNTQQVRIGGQFDTIYNLERMEITTPRGQNILLQDIARVEAISESTFIARFNDQPAIGVHLYKTSSANAVEFANSVDRMIDGWRTTMPNIAFQNIYNTAEDIKESIAGMVQEGLLGALLASIMILMFLRNVRMTLIVLVSIPLSVFLTMLIMLPLNISLNIMTLGAMVIAIGRVVDDSIVVIENIYSQLQKAYDRNESVIFLATKQVGMAISSSTIATAGVFLPLGLVGGPVGEIFRPFAITLATALMASLLVALTVIPMLAKVLVLKHKNIKHEEKTGRITNAYKRALEWSLKHRIKTMLASALVFIIVVPLVLINIGFAFMPESESDKQIIFDIKLPQETSMEMMDATMKNVEAIMKAETDVEGNPKFNYIESLIGYQYSSEQIPYRATMFTQVTDATDAKTAAKEYEEKILYDLPQGSEVIGTLISFSGDMGGGTDFTYSLKGDDLLTLQQAAESVKAKMQEFPELSAIDDSLSESRLQVDVTVDQARARLYGLTSAQVLEAVNGWIRKAELGDLKFDNVLYKTVVEVDSEYKNSLDSIAKIQLSSPTGSIVYLDEVAYINQVEAPVSISRNNQSQVVSVSATIESVDKGGVSTQVAAALNELELPSGVFREVSGVNDQIMESFMDLLVAMAASVFIVYLIMVLSFGNASAPFSILFSLPLAAIGGLLGLLVTRETLNVTSMIGFLMLIGIVISNAIVLIARVQQLREEGHSIKDALVEGGVSRLRPIIMTAGATIVVLFPLALGFSHGALISKGLAVVVIGGLTTSTILTLFIVPVAYEMIYQFNGWVARLFGRKKKTNIAKETSAAQ